MTSEEVLQYLTKLPKDEPFITCLACGFICEERSCLERHIFSYHVYEKPFKCSSCTMQFSHELFLNEHMIEKHSKRRKPVKSAQQYSNRNKKEVIDAEQKDICCVECGKLLRSGFHSEQHMFMHGGIRPHGCKDCKKRFYFSENLKKHRCAYKVEQSFVPKERKKKGIKLEPKETKKHKSAKSKTARNHNGLKKSPENSEEDGEEFSMRRSMRIKTKQLLDGSEYQPEWFIKYDCTKCEKTFTTKQAHDRHAAIHDEITYSCKTCGIWCPSWYSLYKHLLTHEGTDNLCETCGKSFATKYRLKQHLAIFKGMGFYCDKCGKSYHRRCSLMHHLLTHQGKNDCTTCGKSFATKYSLKVHLLTHEGVKYCCSECGSTYLSRQALRKHLHDHTLYTSTKNGTSFGAGEVLNKCVKSEEKEKYDCKECGKSYIYRKSMEAHLYRHNVET